MPLQSPHSLIKNPVKKATFFSNQKMSPKTSAKQNSPKVNAFKKHVNSMPFVETILEEEPESGALIDTSSSHSG